MISQQRRRIRIWDIPTARKAYPAFGYVESIWQENGMNSLRAKIRYGGDKSAKLDNRNDHAGKQGLLLRPTSRASAGVDGLVRSRRLKRGGGVSRARLRMQTHCILKRLLYFPAQ